MEDEKEKMKDSEDAFIPALPGIGRGSRGYRRKTMPSAVTPKLTSWIDYGMKKLGSESTSFSQLGLFS
ncbi:unnamed protein product [Sphenostylis stenocarpa]|uniref:Uncharacterized protein n=1 Tax=Sphenostylis stenocarpa TaxID=92480 RepID=A0AA86SDU6_9FABA|nr:unnamed protein product [Sphenostylis stenocarpa]